MKRLVPSFMMLLACIAVIFYLATSNIPQVNRGELLLWRVMLYGFICGIGWRLHDHCPPHRPTIRRIALIFLVLIMLNEVVPEVLG